MTTSEMACQRCHQPLNRIGDPTNPTAYLHPVSPVPADHQPVPVPVADLDTLARRCDFCGNPHPVWTLRGADVAAVALAEDGGLLQHFGGHWAACVGCEALAAAGRVGRLVDRAGAALGWGRDPQLRRPAEAFFRAFLAEGPPARTLLTTTAWAPVAATARDLPRIRDQLTSLLLGPDGLPGPVGEPALRRRIADGLDRARLYWIDPEFTDLADRAAGLLPETNFDAELLPAGEGLLVWATPVHDALIAAASWTTSGAEGGCQLVSYRWVGAGLDSPSMQRLREQVGWLAPLSTTTAVAGRAVPDRGHTAALVATWLLIAQQVTQTVPVWLDRGTRARYARQQRPTPEVRIVQITPRPVRDPATTTSRSGTGRGRPALREREWVSEHWKQQPYGPGRSRRRLIFVTPYLRGPQGQPIRTTSTVRVLGSARNRTPPPEADQPADTA